MRRRWGRHIGLAELQVFLDHFLEHGRL